MNIEDKLKKFYLEERLSIIDCAKKLNLSNSSVKYYLKKFGIKRNTTNISKGDSRECTKCKLLKNYNDFYYQSYKTTDRKSRQGSWCKSCMSNQVVARQRKYKQQALDYKGNKCQNCGYNKYQGALEFHHRDPTQKDIELSKFSRSPLNEDGKKELDKCDLLCANCHREAHSAD